MENFIVLEDISSSFSTWNMVLKAALEHADSFCVVFPNGEYEEENPLLTGKLEFERLQLKTTQKPWSNLEWATEYTSELNESSKAFIRKYMCLTPSKSTGTLWNFSLLKNGVELLNVQDFEVCILSAKTELIVHLNKQDGEWLDNF
ncbi:MULTISPECIES: hypothetical protein [Planococcus]|uniref:Uncharacterized protein n=1 Tax=Planococcus versutus TaxID=1302659 RepID=A0A1B1S608_9BACL|nr:MULTISPECIES: hypothetical protein [Planococcus]AIY06641.1 hypothetical protein Plano_2676 [Planococcus sp. PAMC 21323]ANU28543.1 hypothetical protein I858_016305 [Planococcus versutus]